MTSRGSMKQKRREELLLAAFMVLSLGIMAIGLNNFRNQTPVGMMSIDENLMRHDSKARGNGQDSVMESDVEGLLNQRLKLLEKERNKLVAKKKREVASRLKFKREARMKVIRHLSQIMNRHPSLMTDLERLSDADGRVPLHSIEQKMQQYHKLELQRQFLLRHPHRASMSVINLAQSQSAPASSGGLGWSLSLRRQETNGTWGYWRTPENSNNFAGQQQPVENTNPFGEHVIGRDMDSDVNASLIEEGQDNPLLDIVEGKGFPKMFYESDNFAPCTDPDKCTLTHTRYGPGVGGREDRKLERRRVKYEYEHEPFMKDRIVNCSADRRSPNYHPACDRGRNKYGRPLRPGGFPDDNQIVDDYIYRNSLQPNTYENVTIYPREMYRQRQLPIVNPNGVMRTTYPGTGRYGGLTGPPWFTEGPVGSEEGSVTAHSALGGNSDMQVKSRSWSDVGLGDRTVPAQDSVGQVLPGMEEAEQGTYLTHPTGGYFRTGMRPALHAQKPRPLDEHYDVKSESPVYLQNLALHIKNLLHPLKESSKEIISTQAGLQRSQDRVKKIRSELAKWRHDVESGKPAVYPLNEIESYSRTPNQLKGKDEPNALKVARKAAEPEKQWGLGKMMRSFEQDLDSLKIES
uniref:Uncharacterized protein n=1 Tax=Guillardia theta TaxID=55529 RepID=A0A7S4PIM0_GUITH|mmetsp:Transcript_50920/g.159106  ORF Transcript_50920/g.159106 Transcript_50920/m.159106 type:complete len:632 (+) Transcript_50920:63-1958(+)